jgi:hypothetical protein
VAVAVTEDEREGWAVAVNAGVAVPVFDCGALALAVRVAVTVRLEVMLALAVFVVSGVALLNPEAVDVLEEIIETVAAAEGLAVTDGNGVNVGSAV